MSLTPWTQHFEVHWPPSLSFFEKRYGILRSLDDAGLLRGFRVGEDRVEARLGGSDHLLAFMPTSMELSMHRPNGDLERLQKAGATVLESMKPTLLRQPLALFHWISAIEAGSYEEARARSVSRLLGSSGVGVYTDFAALIDGEVADSKIIYQLEAGIVEAAELPPRLARSVGRIGKRRTDVSPSTWPAETLPAVALFCNSSWRCQATLGDATWNDLSEMWDTILSAASNIVDSLFDHIHPKADPDHNEHSSND